MSFLQLSREEDNSQLITNPYSSRMPVTDPARFYGRHKDILRIAESIRNWQTFAISGEPRIGKTSLLYYLIHPQGARAQHEFLTYIGNPANYLFVLIELQRLPVRNALGFWRYMLDRLTEEASKDNIGGLGEQKGYASSLISGNDSYEVQTSFESYLKQLVPKVIFLFDDFDIVINDFENTEVIQVTDKLRTLKEALDLNEKLNYIIMSTDPLVRLLKNKGITSPSPFTNIIIPLPPLELLAKDATDELLQEPLQQTGEQCVPQFTTDDIAFIYKLAGRYPDFMKITCFYLFAARSQGNVDYAFVRQQIEHDPHVNWLMNGLWERIKQGEQLEELPLQTVLLQVAQEQKPPNSLAMRELSQRGLVEDANSTPHIFGELFRTFILRLSSSIGVKNVTSPELTHLESKLYSYLVEHMGQTCSREQLEKAIWGNKVPDSRDALEQLVKRVRGKIEPNPDRPIYLLNVRRQGYLLRNTPPKLR